MTSLRIPAARNYTWIYLLFAIWILFASLMAGSFVHINPALAADTPETQRKKARAIVGSLKQRAAPTNAGCAFGELIAAAVQGAPHTTGASSELIVLVFCRVSNEYIFALVRNELKQDALAIGLAAMSTGKHVIVDVEDGILTGIAITQMPIDD